MGNINWSFLQKNKQEQEQKQQNIPSIEYVMMSPKYIKYVQPIIPELILSSTELTQQEKSILPQNNLPNTMIYNNPLQQYLIIVDEQGLKNCLMSSKNTENMNQCILTFIKGTNKINDYNTQLVNLASTNPNSNELSANLTQTDVSMLNGKRLTGFNISSDNQFNNIKINLIGLYQSIVTDGTTNALINNIYGYDSSINQYKNLSLISSNYMVDANGNLISIQNFDILEDNFNSETIYLIILILLYIFVIYK